MNLKFAGMKAVKIIGHVVMATVALVLFGLIVMWLWNWLFPDLFGIKTIDFWHAIGLLILSKIFFGGFRLGEHWGYKRRYHNALREKWLKMSDSEREKFMTDSRHGFGRNIFCKENQSENQF
ncbi:MAG: hypothetical protein LBJ17_07360 [Dysgonamonadaceae bacterium]|jgi:hypothetical protein|nr:hypothetical protein [Dysgonamonadaceae bacterium]